jgi:RNA polymerase subunit RPABC4/transcription elongation factor Spt4
MSFYECFTCHKVVPLLTDSKDQKCPLCGGSNGQVIDGECVAKGMGAGVYHDIDPTTGKPAKDKK